MTIKRREPETTTMQVTVESDSVWESIRPRALLARVAVLSDGEQSTRAWSALNRNVMSGPLPWYLVVLEGVATFEITEIEIDAEGVLELSGPVRPPGAPRVQPLP
jgi:fructose-bisphosphate aldolase class 1